jgi:hypothetical protein
MREFKEQVLGMEKLVFRKGKTSKFIIFWSIVYTESEKPFIL